MDAEFIMKVNFYATLRAIVGKKTLELNLEPQTTARKLVDMVVTEFPPLRKELLDDKGQFHSHMKLFVNGREVVYLKDKFDTIIQPDDKVDVFPPVGGG